MPFVIEPTLTRTFLSRVKKTPNRPAFRFKPDPKEDQWEDITFGQFGDACERVSLGLIGLGIRPGDRVALLSNTRYEWALCDMAILGARAVTVPIYPSSTAQDVALILENSGARALIVEDALQLRKLLSIRDAKPNALPALERILVIEPSAMVHARNHKEISALQVLIELSERERKRGGASTFEKNLLDARPEDLVTICYTSGTTGTPKGVMLTHANFSSVLEDCLALFRDAITPDREVLLSFLPYSHILGKFESISLYTFGWTIAFAENNDKLPANFREVRPTILFTVPRVFEKTWDRIRAHLLELPEWQRKIFEGTIQAGQLRDKNVLNFVAYQAGRTVAMKQVRDIFGGRLKFAVCGGAPLPLELARTFDLAGVRILEGYGLTETCAPVTINPPDAAHFGTVGRPLKDVSIRIADDGEILIRSAKVFAGYYGDERATRDAMEGGWFHTGDVGHIDGEGYLHITDRKKDLIITSGGKNIAPQKIEHLALARKLLSHIVVHGDQRKFLTALVTLNSEQTLQVAEENQILFSDYAELVKNPRIVSLVQKEIDELNSQLASFETIKRFRILPRDFTVEAGELTPSLRVRRRVIEKRFKAEFESMYASASPTDAERAPTP